LMYAFNGDANYTNLPPYFEQLVTLHQAASVVAGVGDNVG
jgi:hypothetical protein